MAASLAALREDIWPGSGGELRAVSMPPPFTSFPRTNATPCEEERRYPLRAECRGRPPDRAEPSAVPEPAGHLLCDLAPADPSTIESPFDRAILEHADRVILEHADRVILEHADRAEAAAAGRS